MTLTEQHIIKKKNSNWNSLDNLCFLSKNLYNSALYKVKKEYLESGKLLRYNDLEKYFREINDENYFNLPTASSQQILMVFDKNVKSYIALIKKWKKDKKLLNGCPKFPKYKDKLKGRNLVIFRGDASVIKFKNNKISFPKKANIQPINTKIPTDSKICQVRIVPNIDNYAIEIVYEVKDVEIIENNNLASIDLGLNNLSALTLTNNKSLIISGRPIKTINQYFNKKKAKLQNNLIKNHKKYVSKKINKLQNKRDNKIKDYLHKTSKVVVDYLKSNNISKLAVGYNKEWKQDINLGSKNNQNFVQIPFYKYLQMLQYKCQMNGIQIFFREESYTSKCSAIDNEEIKQHDQYQGNRILRGLYKTKSGKLINSDINGSLNIGRKEFGDDYFNPANIGFVLNPIKINSL